MDKDTIKKWNNTCILVLSELHGANVIEFWKSIGVDTKYFKGTNINHHYGLFNNKFDSFNRVDARTNHKILTLEEAIAIRDKGQKTFPREMYVWNKDIKKANKKIVVYIAENHIMGCNVMSYDKNHWCSYENAMEIEEYEAINKKSRTLS